MPPRSKKERVFRHMAREVPDYKIVRLYRDELLDFEWSHAKEDPSKWFIEKYLGWWIRLTKIKYGENIQLDLFSVFDIDYNAYRLGGRIMPEKLGIYAPRT